MLQLASPVSWPVTWRFPSRHTRMFLLPRMLTWEPFFTAENQQFPVFPLQKHWWSTWLSIWLQHQPLWKRCNSQQIADKTHCNKKTHAPRDDWHETLMVFSYFINTLVHCFTLCMYKWQTIIFSPIWTGLGPRQLHEKQTYPVILIPSGSNIYMFFMHNLCENYGANYQQRFGKLRGNLRDLIPSG